MRSLRNPVILKKPTMNKSKPTSRNVDRIQQRQGSEEGVCPKDRIVYMDPGGQGLLKAGKEGVLILQVQNPKIYLKKTIILVMRTL